MTIIINTTAAPKTPPTMAAVLVFLPPTSFGFKPEFVEGKDGVLETVLMVVLVPVLIVTSGLGENSGSRPTEIAVASL